MPIYPASGTSRETKINDIASAMLYAWAVTRGPLGPNDLAQKWLEMRTAIEAIYPA